MKRAQTLLIFPREDQVAELAEILSASLPVDSEYSLFQNGPEVFVAVSAPDTEKLAAALSDADMAHRVEVQPPPIFPGMSDRIAKLATVLHEAGGGFKEAIVSQDGQVEYLRQVKSGGASEARSREGASLPWYFGTANRHLCWEAAVVVTSGWGEGSVGDIGRVDRNSVSEATAKAYADAVAKAGAAIPADPSSIPGLPACENPCTLIFQVQFAAVVASDRVLASLSAGGEASLTGQTEGGGASAGLEAKLSFDVDLNEVTVEIQWVVLAACLGEGPPEEDGQADDDGLLAGTSDPHATTETADVFGGTVPVRCPEMSDHGEEQATSRRFETAMWQHSRPTKSGPRSPQEAEARRNALDTATEAASETLAKFRRERRCGPPCTVESAEISIGPVTSAMRLAGSTYGAYIVEYYATCPWYVTRSCGRA